MCKLGVGVKFGLPLEPQVAGDRAHRPRPVTRDHRTFNARSGKLVQCHLGIVPNGVVERDIRDLVADAKSGSDTEPVSIGPGERDCDTAEDSGDTVADRFLDFRQVDGLHAAPFERAGDALAQRMAAGAGKCQGDRCLPVGKMAQSGHRLAHGQRARLVEQRGIDFGKPFQRAAILDQQAVPGERP